jgi:hypothetical protein
VANRRKKKVQMKVANRRKRKKVKAREEVEEEILGNGRI